MLPPGGHLALVYPCDTLLRAVSMWGSLYWTPRWWLTAFSKPLGDPGTWPRSPPRLGQTRSGELQSSCPSSSWPGRRGTPGHIPPLSPVWTGKPGGGDAAGLCFWTAPLRPCTPLP